VGGLGGWVDEAMRRLSTGSLRIAASVGGRSFLGRFAGSRQIACYFDHYAWGA